MRRLDVKGAVVDVRGAVVDVRGDTSTAPMTSTTELGDIYTAPLTSTRQLVTSTW